MTTAQLLISVFTAFAIVSSVASGALASEVDADAERLLGQARILLVCDSGVVNPVERILPKMDWAGFVARDIVFLQEASDEIFVLEKREAAGILPLNTSAEILRRADCERGGDFILIGKDGSVKIRWANTVWTDNLFQTIDAMPMRQFEMRRQQRSQ